MSETQSTLSPPYPRVPHPRIQPSADRKYSEKNPESSKNQNLNLLAGNYLPSIKSVFATIYLAFTLY